MELKTQINLNFVLVVTQLQRLTYHLQSIQNHQDLKKLIIKRKDRIKQNEIEITLHSSVPVERLVFTMLKNLWVNTYAIATGTLIATRNNINAGEYYFCNLKTLTNQCLDISSTSILTCNIPTANIY